MDLTAPISYNGLTIPGLTLTAGGKPSTGIAIDRVDISNIDVEAYLEKRALQDGVDASDVYLGARRVVIHAGVFGSTRAHGFDQLQSFLRAFNPNIAYGADSANLGFLAFDFRQPTISTAAWTAGYVPMRFYLRPLAPPTYTFDRGPSAGADGAGVSFQVQATLLARDPRKYLQSTISTSITTATQTATYRGDFPTWPTASWTVQTGGDGKTLTIVINGLSYVIGFSGVTSGTFNFNLGTQTLTDTNGTNYMRLLGTFPAIYTPIQSGSTFSYILGGGAAVSNPTIEYREAWA